MFVAIFGTIIQGIGDIFWKKSLGYGVGNRIHDLLSYLYGFLIVLYFFIVGFDFKITITLVFASLILKFVMILKNGLNQNLYKTEKISSVIPYTNINKIITLIISFVFADVSILSLIITLFAGIIIIISSFDFKNHKLPQKMKTILLIQILLTLINFSITRLVFMYSEINYFIVQIFNGAIILLIFSTYLGELKTLKGQPKSFWINRYIGGIGWIGVFLGLVVIKNLGLSISILLSFLGIGITLLLSYLILGDKPAKKDLLVTFIVTALVGIGFLYK